MNHTACFFNVPLGLQKHPSVSQWQVRSPRPHNQVTQARFAPGHAVSHENWLKFLEAAGQMTAVGCYWSSCSVRRCWRCGFVLADAPSLGKRSLQNVTESHDLVSTPQKTGISDDFWLQEFLATKSCTSN